MSQFEIINNTPFALEPLLLYDEQYSPVLTVVAKATYDIISTTQLRLASEQEPVCIAGVYWKDPETSSYQYEPEVAPVKLTTDVVLIGHAYGDGDKTTELISSLRIGHLQKSIKVSGNRYWERHLLKLKPSQPQPITKIPLIYEKAFGGKDSRRGIQEKACLEMKNPVGMGFKDLTLKADNGGQLPNLEDPNNLIKSYSDQPSPAGFGFISPHWSPRVHFAGTYDENWSNTRQPLLPVDFDRRFFNAASAGLVSTNYLQGDEPIFIKNASPMGNLNFNLPNIPPPRCKVTLKRDAQLENLTNLDTVIIDCDNNKLFLIWRQYFPLPKGHESLAEVSLENNGIQVLC